MRHATTGPDNVSNAPAQSVDSAEIEILIANARALGMIAPVESLLRLPDRSPPLLQIIQSTAIRIFVKSLIS